MVVFLQMAFNLSLVFYATFKTIKGYLVRWYYILKLKWYDFQEWRLVKDILKIKNRMSDEKYVRANKEI